MTWSFGNVANSVSLGWLCVLHYVRMCAVGDIALTLSIPKTVCVYNCHCYLWNFIAVHLSCVCSDNGISYKFALHVQYSTLRNMAISAYLRVTLGCTSVYSITSVCVQWVSDVALTLPFLQNCVTVMVICAIHCSAPILCVRWQWYQLQV